MFPENPQHKKGYQAFPPPGGHHSPPVYPLSFLCFAEVPRCAELPRQPHTRLPAAGPQLLNYPPRRSLPLSPGQPLALNPPVTASGPSRSNLSPCIIPSINHRFKEAELSPVTIRNRKTGGGEQKAAKPAITGRIIKISNASR